MAIQLGDLVMNINKFTGGLDNHARTRNEPSKAPAGSEAQTQAKDSAGFTDQVKLSASSKSIQQIEAEVRSLPDVDDSTVERIRSQIESGEYKIDYQKLAGKMLDFEERLN
ncbi:flagellar biosynthesis anti-sigma factor FlgM [Bacterioplanoides sp. SCSIO 12839]|uniref:flagellar biosynthesis anti-sigma factor FlgM n=1 Tax=Bacterioplanoides sp. SCSIO 12839 TaxID=2829569 RepID=UPI0021056169|nr:flagellar biosynthesis anti-sigma factor FlgM [Bacterioplanoides sp. SCSIO 12839]